MAQTQTTDEPIYIPTLDELDHMAGLTRPASNDLAPQARLKLRIEAHRELAQQRHEAAAQGVRS